MSRRLASALALVPLLALSPVVQAAPGLHALEIATLALGDPPAKPRAASAGPVSASKPKLQPKPPKYLLKVQFVRTADDDGGRASTLTLANAEKALERANEVYRRKGGDVQFELHPASNFDALIESTALNRDCIMAPGQTDATIDANTKGDVDGDGQVATDADRDMLCDYTTSTTARTAYAIERADRIIVYSRGGNDAIAWDASAKHWVASHPSGGASSALGYYVRMPKSFGNDTLLAHEVGHYLHTAHTFGSAPKTVAEARASLEKYAKDNPGADPRDVFDGDSRVQFDVHDTPPDPRASLLIAVHGGDGCDPDPAKGRVTISATVDGSTKDYVLEPDRALVMSYFKGCAGFDHYQSKGQYAQIHAALDGGNRKGLVAGDPGGCYAQTSDPGTPVSTKAQLALLVRKVSQCILLYRKPLPWEMVTGDIYVNPADRRAGFVRKGDIAVHIKREAALLETMIKAEIEE